jgi:hypothetical protein
VLAGIAGGAVRAALGEPVARCTGHAEALIADLIS